MGDALAYGHVAWQYRDLRQDGDRAGCGETLNRDEVIEGGAEMLGGLDQLQRFLLEVLDDLIDLLDVLFDRGSKGGGSVGDLPMRVQSVLLLSSHGGQRGDMAGQSS